MTRVNPGTWVNPENLEDKPWCTQKGIVKFLEFPVRIPEMSHRAFHLYWLKHHSPNVMNVTEFAQFMRKYNCGHVYPKKIEGLPEHYQQNTRFEGAAEVWLNSLEEVVDWLGQPSYAELIQPDEPRFISEEGDVEVILSKEERLYEPVMDMVENHKTKLYVLVRRTRGDNYDDFHEKVSTHGKLILGQESLKRHLEKFIISHKLREPHPDGFELSDIDAVFEFWFKDTQIVEKFYQEEAYRNIILPDEDNVFDKGSTRAVVAKMRVIHDEFSFQASTTQPLGFNW